LQLFDRKSKTSCRERIDIDLQVLGPFGKGSKDILGAGECLE
jgi:hypothetical protein